jgi:hypothetical protein
MSDYIYKYVIYNNAGPSLARAEDLRRSRPVR